MPPRTDENKQSELFGQQDDGKRTLMKYRELLRKDEKCS